MEKDSRVSMNGDGPLSSYWLDACEDMSCDVLGELINLGADNGSSDQDGLVNVNDFFGGIDHILDSIRNGSGVPSPRPSPQPSQPSKLGLNGKPSAALPAQPEALVPSVGRDAGREARQQQGECPGKSLPNDVPWNGNRDKDSDFVGQERGGKRARFSNSKNERIHSSKGHWYQRDRDKERGFNRKRPRESDETDRRDRDRVRRREHYSAGTRRDAKERDWRDREPRGYWERDRQGSNEIIFRLGTWDADSSREVKSNANGSHDGNGVVHDKPEEHREKLPEEQARQYQLDVLEQAKKKNTIAFLETGAGKTLIAVLLMKSVCTDQQKLNKKMLAVFLVPKVPLVYQQAEVIRERTGFQVGHYCGEMGQDFWDARRWHREFETKQVLVMTAQILLNILRHSIIKMESINLLILDECHHAVKKHPYSLVMSEFYHTTPKEKRPSVFGMTASPVNLKGVSSQVDCAIKIHNLESKLDSTVCTIKDRKELEKHVPMPSEVVVEYDKAASLWSLHEHIKQMEVAVEEAAQSSSRRSKWQFMGARDAGAKEELRQIYGVSERTESDGAANLIQKLRAINYALGELGQWCAYKVAQSFLTALQNDERTNYQLDVKFQESYLTKVVTLLQCQLSEGAVAGKDVKASDDIISEGINPDEIEEGELPNSHVVSGGEHVDEIIGAAVADGKVTPKVQSLIKILLKYQHTEDFRAIIFVERVVAALVLPKVFAELPSLSFVKCASLIGHNNSQEMRTCQMHDTIGKFRDGRVTLLVATSVAEEGLDIRQCNVVIRFDLAKTVLAYIQSRGRARKPGSDYILMVERGNLSHAAFLRNARNSEETLRKEAIERTDLSHLKDTSRFISVDATPGTVYQVESTGAVVSLNSAVGLIHFYCSQLPSDRYSILRPEFIMERHENPGGPTEYSCRLQLPCNAPFEKLEGPVCRSMRLAQQAVCLAACKKLHEMGAFTDMLLPDKGSGEEGKKADPSDEGNPLPGTAQHREFYPEGVANVLKGDWILCGGKSSDSSKLLHLHMYAVKCVNVGSTKDQFLTQVSDFAVLFGNKLDAEVLSMSMDLFVARTMITKASLVYKGAIDITENQLTVLKSFHVRLMSIVLDVDVEPSTTPWDPAKAYLFVPVVGDESIDPFKEIDWNLVGAITRKDAWSNPLQRARPDVYLGTNERTLGGDRREYGFGKLRHGMAFGNKSHPTYGIRGAKAQFDVVKASGIIPSRDAFEMQNHHGVNQERLVMADSFMSSEDLVGRIVTAAHSGKRFYVDSICYDMNANNSFPRKEGYLGPLEYSSYADYYRQKYGVDLIYKEQPLIRGRGVSYCKNLLSPRFEHSEAAPDETLDKTYYVFLPPELCLVHPLPGSLVRGAQRLPSIMRRVESMLLAVQLKDVINYPVPASRILEALTAASCQETFCYERAELLGDAYLKWVVSRFLFLKYPQKHEGQLTRMRQQMVSNMVLYEYALSKGLQSYIQADRFAPSRWAAPGVLPVYDEDIKDDESSLFDDETSTTMGDSRSESQDYADDDDEMEDGELENDSSSYRVLSSKTLADVVEALIGVYYVEGGKIAANHLMKWVGIQVEFDNKEIEHAIKPSNVPESVLRSVDFDTLEAALFHYTRNRSRKNPSYDCLFLSSCFGKIIAFVNQMASMTEPWVVENGGLKGASKEIGRHGRTAHNMSSSSLRKKSELRLVSKVPCRLLRLFLANIQEVILGTKLSILFPAIPLAIVAECYGFGRPWVFALSLLGLTPLAERVSFLTEQIAYYTGPTVGGLLNATCGNATELIIAIFALGQRKIEVVKYSLLGSILSNLLLVLGTSLLCGGLANLRKEQKFDRKQADVNSLMLLLGLLCHLLPLLFRYAGPSIALTANPTLELSRASSIVMLLAYTVYIFFQLVTHRQMFEAQEDSEEDESLSEEVAVIGFWSGFVWLVGMTLIIALLSEYVVDTIEAASDSWGLSVSFLSIILLPIVGNAAEHAGAIIFAFKNKLDISLGVALGSATQIGMFVVPLCVVVAWIMGIKMDLNFNLLETGSLALSIIVTGLTLQDGTSHYMKGLVLLLCYIVIGACFFVLKTPLKQSNPNGLGLQLPTDGSVFRA